MSKWLALWCVGCGVAPAAVEIVGGDEAVVVHELGTIDLPTAVARDAEGKEMVIDEAFAWKVEPESVARWTEGGLELLADGTATVTVSLGELNDQMTVEVSLPDAVAIDASRSDAAAVGTPVALTAVVSADGKALLDRPVTWTVSDPAVATIDASGALTFVAPGTVVVTATSGALSSTVELTLAPPAEAVPQM